MPISWSASLTSLDRFGKNAILLGSLGADSVNYPLLDLGGDLDSTGVAKPEVHAELQTTRKTDCKTLVANDDNYALAA
jgi:hypothetical protein